MGNLMCPLFQICRHLTLKTTTLKLTYWFWAECSLSTFSAKKKGGKVKKRDWDERLAKEDIFYMSLLMPDLFVSADPFALFSEYQKNNNASLTIMHSEGESQKVH